MKNLAPFDLGETYSKEALPHLVKYLGSDAKNEVRLAASAVSKIATVFPLECLVLLPELLQALQSSEGQVRQYILNALARLDLPEKVRSSEMLSRIARSDEKHYNRKAANDLLNPNDQCTFLSNPEDDKEIEAPPVIELTGEQRRVLALPLSGEVKIKGVAGSGKTTIAVYRLRQLIESGDDFFRDTKLCVFSYTKSLVAYVRSLLGDASSNQNVVTSTLHSWIYQFLKERGYWSSWRVAKQWELEKSIRDALSDLSPEYRSKSILRKEISFYVDEVSWLKGNLIRSLATYIDTKRVGRGSQDRVTQEDKHILWELYEKHEEQMKDRNLVHYDDFAIVAIDLIEKTPDFIPPFSHIVVDEGQDLSALQYALIKRLVSPDTDSITIIADSAQQIYKSGFTWASIGINIRGNRSIELKRNYRNTKQIAELALSLLDQENDTEEFTEQMLPERHGKMPILFRSQNLSEMYRHVDKALKKIDLDTDSVVLLHRKRRGVSEVSNYLTSMKYNSVKIQSQEVVDLSRKICYVCTMPSVKGLEFDHVLIIDVNENVIPMSEGFSDVDDDLHISTERRLLYTCITRAKKEVLLFCSGTPSRYIAEFNPQKYITR